MNRSPLHCFFVATSFAALVSVSPVAGQAANSGVQEFDPQAFPGQVVDDVVVPVPSEVFSVLDKLGEPNWRQEIRTVDLPKTGDRTKLSLMFGLVVAEGFVAVQAEDKEAVKDIGREVIDLATALGLIKSVRPHAQAILDAADKSDWASIRKEFDQTQKTVRDSMEQMKDADLSQCVSMGGWLRGTSSVTSVITKSFSADRAELLNQPMLVEHFISSIGKMSKDKKEHPNVSDISKGLKLILAKMEGAVDGFTKDGVREIGKTCDSLLTDIQAAR
ncbi:hypothetical protein EI77_02900 [Prosthecobacter fusiformis]|uniref:Secreted protein n=1 Tax=Prosthecobacter fusiformis TaxID=48464 RepID=A0A4R7RU39_9BACT|nr:hypothetical protein [Prosthecobacter fusiformis]TDU69252.1 hypothetical protein EI77_02900 [Prosthecobacter fusiformis]